MLKTKFCERFALDYPIIQAPMAGVSNPLLAAEVLKAGALPSMGCGAMNAAALDKSISEFMVLSSTEKAPLININFFAHQKKSLMR
ncbi:nitronate monooxygenase [Oligella ureolytica]